MEEVWKDIRGYEGYYQISSCGRIKSLDRKVKHLKGGYAIKKGKILKQCYDKDGYLLVVLYKNNKKRTRRVHRLVAMAFIPNPNNYPQINHRDEDKTNNTVQNLEWCDAKYNNAYGTRTERIFKQTKRNEHAAQSLRNHPSFSKSVVAYKDGVEVLRFASQAEARRMGFVQGNISACCRGERKYHKGLTWKYAT